MLAQLRLPLKQIKWSYITSLATFYFQTMRWRLDKLLPDTRYECLVQVDIKTTLTNFSANFVIFRPGTDTGGVRRARCSRSRLCPTHTKVSSWDWLVLSLSPSLLSFLSCLLWQFSVWSQPFNEISVASSFSRHLFCSYQASFSSWGNLFVFNVKRNLWELEV